MRETPRTRILARSSGFPGRGLRLVGQASRLPGARGKRDACPTPPPAPPNPGFFRPGKPDDLWRTRLRNNKRVNERLMDLIKLENLTKTYFLGEIDVPVLK